MATKLITEDIWPQITKAVKHNKKKSFVAVAYFGKGGAKMLPLKSGSKLVVDASEHVVKSGQTDPKELLKLYKKGVEIYSRQNLHAKTYVIGSKLYLGSINVSHNSADHLQEAVLLTTERESVKKAKSFIGDLSLIELGKKRIDDLIEIYRPPKNFGAKGTRKRKKRSTTDGQPRIRVVNLVYKDYPEGYEKPHEVGMKEAKSKPLLKERHITDDFGWNHSSFKRGEVVLQIISDANTKKVFPPSVVTHKKSWKTRRGNFHHIIYYESRNKRSRNMGWFKKHLSTKEIRKMQRSGLKDSVLSNRVLALWK